MKIVIAAVSSATQLSGVTRHAANVARCLLTRSEISAVHLIGASWQHPLFCEAVSRSDARLHIHSVPINPGVVARNLWYYKDLPAIAAQLEADIIHLAFPAPLHGSAFRCPTIVTLHDLYPYDVPENFGFPKVLFNRLVLWQCLKAADAIACVSQNTLQRLFHLASSAIFKKAVKICNCIEPIVPGYVQSPLPGWNGEPFFLCVAQHRRNKNVLLTLQIFRRLLRLEKINPASILVIVGVPGPETLKIHRYLFAAGLNQKVLLLSGIRDTEMQWCYRNCELLLAPSSVEGFGLPVAEALLVGCRIVCSDILAFRELEGNGCHYVPLTSNAEEAFADAISEVLTEPKSEPTELPQLSAPVIAEEYVELYRRLLARTGSSSPIRT